jgi:hypothetical protein
MKKIFTLSFALLAAIILHAQVCTTSGFDVCTAGSGVTSDFRNAVQIAGTGSPLTVGAKYKFNNAIPNLNLDAVISIDAMVNTTMADAASPSIDDDGAADETGTAASQVALFAPRIAPNQTLSCTSQSGYVEFNVKFYNHYSGNAAPIAGTEIAVANLNFLHFDMDGSMQGSDGWFKEIGYAKINGADPINYGAAGTELLSGNDNGWLLTTGSINERNGVSRCSEVIEKSVYLFPQSAITFRMGYDYKAPTSNCSSSSIQPTRQYGSKFGCFNLPSGGPLPVSLVNLAANYNEGKSNITWTSLQEQNLDSYEIQRSYDGINFETAGNVKANNLTSLQQYKFTDNLPAFNSKYIYYRVRVVDLDYSMKLTNTVSIKVADWKTNEMIISPNPSGSSGVQIKIKTTKAATGAISVFDASGKLILKQQATLLAGNNSVVLNNITQLAEGYYTVRLIANNEIFSSKLLIWK